MTDTRALIETAVDLFDRGQYDRLAELIESAHGQSDQGHREAALRSRMRDVVRWMCQARSEEQAEEAAHREALSRIENRQQVLKHNLKEIVELVNDPKTERHRIAEGSGRAPPVEEETTPRDSPSEDQPSLLRHPLRGLRRGLVDGASPVMAVYCLGQFRVYFASRFVEEWANGKGKAIFKFLVSCPQHRAAKEVLMELFWPNAEPHAARNNLNVAIYGLRRAFASVDPFSVVLFRNDSYLVNPELEVWIDHEAFIDHLRAGQALERRGEVVLAMCEYERAEALYQGEFLEEDRYEEWPESLRRNLRDQYLMVLDRLGEYAFERHDYAACAELCRKMTAVDPCHEEAHRRLMRCWSRQGLLHMALRQYHVCREELARELQIDPSPVTVELFSRIRQRHIV